MSTTIDERVVEMRFDNKQFESNVSTSMSTLKKLKESLKFTGATKGLEEIDAASKRVNMSGLGGAVDSVKAKFSALDVVAVTALANITNSAVNTGKRLIASLSVDQISAGWRKFGEKTTSVATLVAQGNAIEDVNKQLNLLNWFTDETSYNFTDMVANIAKFTASGKGLEESVTAMEGIATWAALSGQNAMTASRAMYQLSQAMGAGVMRREDYRSIQNASMDTKEFRENCIEAAIALGTLKDNGDGTYSSLVSGAKQSSFTISQFADNLTDGLWLTSDVMMSVYTKYASAVNGIYEAVEEKGFDNASQVLTEIHNKADQLKTDGMSDAEAIDAAIKELGYTLEDSSLKFDHFGVKAFEAAQQARTFADVIDSVKDAVSTGWMNTFEKIFGDSNQATELWTMMANELWDTFAGGSERRNDILDSVMVSGWDKLKERITEAGIEVDAYESKVKELAKAGGADVDGLIKEYGSLSDVFKNGALDTDYLKKALDSLTGNITEATTGLSVDLSDILPGKYGETMIAWGSDATESIKKIQTALTELGYDLSKYGANGIFKDETWAAVAAFQKDAGLKVTGQVDQATLDALAEAGKSLQTISENAEGASVEIDDLLDSLSRPSGRELVFDIISNSLTAINTVLGTFREAWANIFSEGRVASGLYNMLAGLKSFSESLILNEESVKKLSRTLEGFIGIVDIIATLVGETFKFAFDVVSEVLKAFGIDILGASASLGDMLLALRKWIVEGNIIGNTFGKLLAKVTSGINVVKDWVDKLFGSFKKSKVFQNLSKTYKELSLMFKLFNDGKIGVDELRGALKRFLGVLGDVLSPIDNLITAFKDWFATFKDLDSVQEFLGIITEIRDTFNSFFSGEIDVSQFGAKLGESLAKLIKSIPNIISEAAKTVWESSKQIGSDFVTGFENGITGKIGETINNIVEFCLSFVSSFAEALGVQSPSWKAYEIACDFFQGAINGINDMLQPVLEALKPIGEGILKAFRSFWGYVTDENGDVEWGKIISGGITISSLVILNKFAKALDKFASAATSFSGIISGVTGVLTQLKESIKSLGKSIALDFKADALMKLAISLGILMASIWLLSQVDDYGKLWNAVGIIAVLTVILFSLSWAIDKLSAASIKWDKGPQIEGIKSGLIQIGIALLLVAAVVKIVGSIPEPEAKRGFAGVAAITVGMMVFLAAIGRISKYSGDVGAFAKTMIGMAAAMLVMTYVIKMVAKLDPADIIIGLAVMEIFSLICIQIGIANRLAGAVNNGAAFTKMAVALGIMAIVLKILSKIDPDDMFKGLLVMEVFALILIEMGVANRIAGGETDKFGSIVLSMSFSMLIMAGVFKILSKISEEDIKNGIKKMQGFLLLIAEMILVSKIAGKEGSKVAGNVLSMAVAIGILVGVLYLLRMMEDVDMKKPMAVIAGLSLCIAAMIWATRGANNVRQNLMTLTTTIGVMAAAVILLSFIEKEDLMKATAALGSLMLLFALMTKAATGFKDTKGWDLAAIAVMAGAIGALVGVVFVLAKFTDTDKAIKAAEAMSILMLAFAVTMRIVSKAGGMSREAVGSLVPILLVAIGLAAILAALSILPNSNSMIPNAIALGILLNAMASAMLIMSKAGRMSKTVSDQIKPLTLAIGGLSIILGFLSLFPNSGPMIPNAIALSILLNALAAAMVILNFAGPNSAAAVPAVKQMGVVLLEVAVILGILNRLGIEASIQNAIALSILMIAMSAACRIVSKVPLKGAIEGALGLATFLGIMTGLVAIIGALSGDLSTLENGAKALSIVGIAIGEFIGGILGGVISGAGKALIGLLPELGTALSGFMSGASGFISTASGLDSSVVAGAGYMAAAIAVLAGAGFIAGVASILSLGTGSFAMLGIQLMGFALGARAFAASVSGIDESAVQAAKCVADMILALSASTMLNGLSSIFGLSIDYVQLATDLTNFGNAVVGFSDTISGKVDAAAVEAATNAGNLLVALNDSLPKSGGLVQKFFGETDFESFAKGCVDFAKCMVDLNNALSGDDYVIQEEKIESLITAGDLFAKLQDSLPRSNGVVQKFLGHKELGPFATACKEFTTCMLEINDALGETGLVIQSYKIEQITKAGDHYADLVNALPKSNGVLQKFVGHEELESFGEACKEFTACMIKVNEAVSTEGFTVNLEAIEQLKQAGLKMEELQDALPKSGGWWQEIAGSSDIGDFGTKIGTFATAIVNFSSKATGLNISAIDLAILTAYRIKTLLGTLVGIDYSGVAEFTGADGPMYKLGEAISEFSSSLDGINTENINVAVNAATRLRDLISGLVGFDTSGVELFKPETIGTAIKSYSDNISDIDIEKISTSITCANRLKTFISGLIDLDSSGVTNFTPESIGGALLAYNTQIAGIDNAKISSTIAISNRLKTLISELADLDDSGVAKFKIVPIATNLKSYSSSVAGVNESAVSSSVSAATKLKTFIADLAGLDTSGVETFNAAVASLSALSIEPLVESLSTASETMYTSGTTMIGMLVKAFNEGASKVSTSATKVITDAKTKIESKKGDFKTAGKTLVTSFAYGISNDSSTASSRAETMAYNAGAKASNSGYSKFYDAGTYCVQGFAYGIEIKTYIVEDIAYKMGEKAAKAAKKAIDSNSPSKVFMKIGTYVPQGFAIGIGSLSDKVEGAATKMAKTAINGTRSAMTTLLDTLNTDMDMQPTIRPVVDLSDVRTGAAAVSGIFGNVQTVGVRSNLNAINLAMNSRSQNRGNDDIISAINKLGAGLENSRGDTYNFGDFTYDDGSNVADAVGTLIRYAKIGRRV